MRPWLPPLVLLVALAVLSGPSGAGDKKTESTQQAKTFQKDIVRHVKLNYWLFLPEGYYDKSDKRFPLILFLHGAGESGDKLEKVKVHGPPKIVEKKKDFPFIVVSPQSPKFGWDIEALNALLDDVLAKYRVDSDRVYLTGLSMGGYGSWALAAAHPERFAAVVPICGGGSPVFMGRRLKDMPVWAFHGAKDNVVPLKESEQMVNAIKKAGGNAKLTVYPDAGHDSWTATYNNPELYRWLLEQRRKGPATQRE
jgi:predicted peptidase